MTIDAAQLRGLAAFNEFSDEELARFVELTEARQYEQGWPIYEEGKPGRSALVLVSGEVEIRKHLGKGDMTVARLSPGVMVGQGALADRSHRMVSLVAVTPVAALAIDRSAYRQLLDELDPVAMRIQRQVAIAGIRQLRAATLAVARTAARITEQHDRNIAFMDSADSAVKLQASLDEWALDFKRLIEG